MNYFFFDYSQRCTHNYGICIFVYYLFCHFFFVF
jgi:hypothetical protein